MEVKVFTIKDLKDAIKNLSALLCAESLKNILLYYKGGIK